MELASAVMPGRQCRFARDKEVNMKSLVVILLCAVISSVANAQVTCQTNGNTTNCNGSLGQQIPSVPFIDYAGNTARAQLAQQQAQTAQAQAELIRAQTDALRQQTAAIQRQEFLARVAVASDDDLQKGATDWGNRRCWGSAACQGEVDFALSAIREELRRRNNRNDEQQGKTAESDSQKYVGCLERFLSAQSAQVANIVDTCKANPAAVP